MLFRSVLSGYFGFKNFGDEAILSVLVQKLKQLDKRITVISSDPQYTTGKFKHIRSVYTFKIPDIIGAISKSDFLISGGGSLLQDTTSLKSLIYYLFVIFTWPGVPFVSSGQPPGAHRPAPGPSAFPSVWIARWCAGKHPRQSIKTASFHGG